MPPSSDYDVVRHASIAGAPGPSVGLAWVVIAHWQFENGSQEWYTEYWDRRRNEESPEMEHGSEAQAVEFAESLFGPLQWRDGPPGLDASQPTRWERARTRIRVLRARARRLPNRG